MEILWNRHFKFGVINDSKPNLHDFFDICVEGKTLNLLKKVNTLPFIDFDFFDKND